MKIDLKIYSVPEFDRVANKIWARDEIETIYTRVAKNFHNAISLGKGLYKLRLPVEHKGKSGGARVIFLSLTKDKEIILLTAFKKADQGSLTKKQMDELAEIGKLILEKGNWKNG